MFFGALAWLPLAGALLGGKFALVWAVIGIFLEVPLLVVQAGTATGTLAGAAADKSRRRSNVVIWLTLGAVGTSVALVVGVGTFLSH